MEPRIPRFHIPSSSESDPVSGLAESQIFRHFSFNKADTLPLLGAIGGVQSWVGGGQELRETCHLSNSNIRYSQIQPFYQVKEKLTDSCLHRCSPKSHDLKAKWMFIVSNSNIYCYYTNYLYKIFFNWKERKNLLETFFFQFGCRVSHTIQTHYNFNFKRYSLERISLMQLVIGT